MRQSAILQRFQQTADHGNLTDPSASDHDHEPQRVVLEEIPDHRCLHMPVLKPGRCDRWRRIDELAVAFVDDRRPRGGARVSGRSQCAPRFVVFGDPLLKLLDLLLNTRLLLRLRRLELALEIFELVLQHLDGTFWGCPSRLDGDAIWQAQLQGRLSPMGALFARGLKPALSVAEASKKQYLLFFTTQQET